ncbi:MAG TPA: restriction endonuclease subunit S [Sporosarcina psychrophila]|uniref:Restriction endonuclease subunit S n=1 Tax=Sporosarcina psychrophila TaxID=1476 RepID=A0A921FVN4_SPOPS|nr:restriction endonuclease subunit S [Sporosarcina psychrophila]
MGYKYIEHELGDVLTEIFSGGTPNTQKKDYWNGDLHWLSSGETRNRVIKETEKSITELGAQNSSTKLAKRGDVVMASAGQGFTRGQTSIIEIDTYINQSLIALRGNPQTIDNKYLFYNLSSRYQELRMISDSSSIRGSITTKMLKKMKIMLPNIEKQKSVSSFLWDLDKKIDINKAIINNLDQLSQILFKQWFIDFEFPNEEGKPYKSSGGEMVESELGEIPKGWSTKSLDEIAKFQNGLAMQKFRPKENADSLPVLKIKELNQGNTTLNSERCSLNIKQEVKVFDGDVIFSWSGTLLVKLWTGGDAGLNQHLFKVTSEKYEKWFYYLWTKYYLKVFQARAAEKATTMGHIKRSHLKEAKIYLPPEKVLTRATDLIQPLIEKIIILGIENKNLTQLRDTLLPKLLSGEIEIPDDMEV